MSDIIDILRHNIVGAIKRNKELIQHVTVESRWMAKAFGICALASQITPTHNAMCARF